MSNTIFQFAETLKMLNIEQSEAVRNIEGPVLVVAGPGTGKTHILSARIGQILTETDTAPYNILCLTFTDAGVQAMRERLTQLIGAAAHKVHIFTFHSFCNKVIQDNLDFFGRQDLGLIDDLERHDIIRQILSELPHDHILKKYHPTDPYFYEKHLIDLFRIIKTEAWSIDFILNKINNYIAELPQRPDFIYQNTRKGEWKKGDLKTQKIDEESRKMEILAAAVQLYPKYITQLRGVSRYDFDDMILWVIDAFERLPFLLRHYQEQYLYFLVDEYQDTNGAQNRVLAQLIGFWDNPNIFIVGDDDQAIYEFQGARLKSLIDFYEAYKKDLKVIALKDNYRSVQSILNTSKQLIDLNNLRIINELGDLKIEKKLIAKGGNNISNVFPTVIEYPNRLHEIADIIEQIDVFKQQKYPLSNIAIIYARHREAEPLIQLLEKKGIPYQTKRRINVLDTPMIQNLMLLLRYFCHESEYPFSGDYLLFKILNINFLNISQKDILKFTTYIARHRNELQSSESFKPSEGIWRTTLFDLPNIGLKNTEKWKALREFVDNCLKNIGNEPLLTFLEQVINKSGLLVWANKDDNRILNLQVLQTFFEFVRAETHKRPRLTLSDLLSTLDILDKNKIPLELLQTIASTEGVTLTTAHSAKGLEFEHVFLIDTLASEWENSKSANNNRFKLPDTLTYSTEEDAVEARRRLFYVAMTRAKTHLQISYAKADDKGKTLERSLFIDEILTHESLSNDSNVLFKKRILDDTILIKNQITAFSDGEKIDTQLVEKEYISYILKDFKLSISALNLYLDCPLSFYFEYILKIPDAPKETVWYGSAVHYALQKLFGEMLRSKDKQFPSEEDFIGYFEKDMYAHRGHIKESDFQRRLINGRNNLRGFYSQNINKWEKNVVIEKPIFAESDGVPMRGVLDKITFLTDSIVHITDYKTGKPDETRMRRPTPKSPNGGYYWRQLVFYKILYENFRSHLVRVKTGEISYVEPDTKGIFKSKILEIEPKDVEQLRGLIVTVWDNIQQHNFKGCGKKDCRWCQFVKNNQTVSSFGNAIIEEMDD